jgi:hypothetical protein
MEKSAVPSTRMTPPKFPKKVRIVTLIQNRRSDRYREYRVIRVEVIRG